MTSEILYKQLLASRADNYKRKHDIVYDTYKVPMSSIDICTLIENKKYLENSIQILEKQEPQSFSFDPIREIKEYYVDLIEIHKEKRQSILSEQKKSLEDLEEERIIALAMSAKSAKKQVQPLEEKHDELMLYKDRLVDILVRYNVKPSDIKIADDLTFDEIDALLNTSIEICKRFTKEQKSISKYFYWPIDEGNTKFAIYYIVFILILFYFLSPFISIFIIGYMFYSTLNMYRKLDKLRIAQSLMYTVDFSKFIDKEKVPVVNPIDTSPLEKQISEKIKELENDNPLEEQQEQERIAAENLASIKKEIDSVYQYGLDKFNSVKHLMHTALDETNKSIDAYMEDMKEFGSYINESYVMNHSFVVGKIDSLIDVLYEGTLSNMVFNTSLDKMKLYFCNMLLSVKEKHLYVTVYDPDFLGASLSEFYTKDTQEYIQICTDNWDKIFNEHRLYAQDNIKMFGEEGIDNFNRSAEKQGRVTRDYKLLLVISDTKKVKESAGFLEFMKYSAKFGVIIWLMDTQSSAGADFITDDYVGNGNAITYDPILGANVLSTFEYWLENSKCEILYYDKEFQPKYVPRDKWWTYSTKYGLELKLGLVDGDPTKGRSLILGDSDVHFMLVGGTGTGKSNIINELTTSAITMYSPEELMLVYLDLKNVEFSGFSRQAETGILKDGTILQNIRDIEMGRSLLPHAKVLAGTKDGEYGLSIFKYLYEEMERRNALFAKAGVKKLAEYRDKYPDEIMPRILIIVDEFQALFEGMDQRILDQIISLLTLLAKLLRSCGGHLGFTSQSMKGTISKDVMDQFSLRMALKCSSDLSEGFLGNKAASMLKTKQGYCYTNDSGGEDPSRNTLWRIPLIEVPVMMKTIDDVIAMSKDRNALNNNAKFYDEKEQYTNASLDNWYREYSEAFVSPYTFILGEVTNFSTNKAPVNFRFTDDDGENLAAIAFERRDLLNLVMTFVDNIKKSEECTLIINSADRETHTLLELETLVDPSLKDITYPTNDMDSLVSALEGMLDSRRDKSKEELKPAYFIAIQWEKAEGISKNNNSRIETRFIKLLQDAPLFKIHFIFICKDLGDFPLKILTACSHRIAAKTTDTLSYRFIESGKAFKLPSEKDGIFAIYKYGDAFTKFKVYQHTFTKELESRTVVIE